MNQQNRLGRLKERLSNMGIEGALVTSPLNVYYFTGFYCDPMERFLALWVDIKKDADILFVPGLDAEAARASSGVSGIVPVGDTEDPYEVLASRTGRSIKTLGIEKKHISQHAYERIAAALAPDTVSEIEDAIMSFRFRKTEEELDRVRKAVRVAEQAMELGVKLIKPGMAELELVAEIEYQIRVLGGERPAFATSVLGGARSANPHGKPAVYRFQPNDYILIDMGVYLQGYCSDITRTFLLGEGTKQQHDIYETVLEANRRAIEAVKPGEPFSRVDIAARSHIESRGYGPYFNHRVGHGFGIEIHEPPSVHGQADSLMAPGALFTIEPGIYVPQTGGVRIEDDVCIHEDGRVEVLTRYPKELIRLPV
ncbi:M24 family metallopeptidase [Paenibacillus alkalitolerans]|uniref:M24 family metallopeptidase n=1 Tax=Paenibacillus alkalitolerans TaxID=2799335 RepID=UPI0018F70EAF|nr:Xaa-Pro peptidase family protein [Paenibacillus alkalitolerans]